MATGYSSRELSIFQSCVNEYAPALKEKVIFSDSTRWFSLSEEEKDLMHTIDTCRSILKKTGYFKKYGLNGRDPDFSFQKVMHVLDKIHRSLKICINKTGEGRIYNLAFVFENTEILKLNPYERLRITDLTFAPTLLYPRRIYQAPLHPGSRPP